MDLCFHKLSGLPDIANGVNANGREGKVVGLWKQQTHGIDRGTDSHKFKSQHYLLLTG